MHPFFPWQFPSKIFMQVVYQIVKKVQNRRCHCFNIHCLELDLAGPDFVKSRDGRPDLNLFKIFQMTFSFQTFKYVPPYLDFLQLLHLLLHFYSYLEKTKTISSFCSYIFFCFEEFWRSKTQKCMVWLIRNWYCPVRELFEWAPTLETTKNDQKYKMFIPVLYTVLSWFDVYFVFVLDRF